MGACSIEVTSRGKSMTDAFRRAQERAQEEYGNDSYNGQINNCSLVGDVTDKQHQFKEQDYFHTWILNNTGKRDVKGYCISKPVVNNNKIKTVVTNFPQKGTRKWETLYVGVTKFDGNQVCSDASQTECIKKARAWVEKNPDKQVDVTIRKKLTEGKNLVASINYKKATNEKDGLYCFVGWAPE